MRLRFELCIQNESENVKLADCNWIVMDPFVSIRYNTVVIKISWNNFRYSCLAKIFIATPDPRKRKDIIRAKDYDRMALPNFNSLRDPSESFVTVTITSLTLTHFTIVIWQNFLKTRILLANISKIVYVWQNEEDQTFQLEAWPSFVSNQISISLYFLKYRVLE